LKPSSSFFKSEPSDLDENIRCGNSLIDGFYETGPSISSARRRWRVNAFDWKSCYPEVFGRTESGFDAVIGNPPTSGFNPYENGPG